MESRSLNLQNESNDCQLASGNGDNSKGGKYPLMELVLGNVFRGVGKKSCKVFSEAESNRD